MSDSLLRPAVLGPALLITAYLLYHALRPRPKLPPLPIVGSRPGDVFPVLQAQVRNILDFKAAVVEAYARHRDRAVLLPLPGSGTPVLLPVAETQWVVEQPESVLSLHENAINNLQIDLTTSEPELIHNPTHTKLITTTLTSQIGNLIPAVADEAAWSFAQHWGTASTWTEVGVYDSTRRVIGSVTNRVFVGLPACRDPRLLDAGMAFAQDVPQASMVLRLLWAPLRPLAARVITRPNHRHWAEFLAVVRPEVERRLREYDLRQQGRDTETDADPEKTGSLPPPRNDYLEWTVRQAKESGDPYMYDWRTIAGRILLLNFAAIHTTSFTLTSVLIDLAYADPAFTQELRAEVRAALDAAGGAWTKQALARMEKLDSTLRESARLNSFVTVGLGRTVVAPEGATTPSGLHLPQGSTLFCHAYPVFRDPAHYEAPDEFRPFRFAERRHEEGIEYVKAARNAFPTTSNEFLAFGHGRYACPGRFFAANEVKLLLGHALLSYDFEAVHERPKNTWIGLARIPPMKAVLRVRRRKDADG
jgi:cytochrome P450